jgi:hypothetical protein
MIGLIKGMVLWYQHRSIDTDEGTRKSDIDP